MKWVRVLWNWKRSKNIIALSIPEIAKNNTVNISGAEFWALNYAAKARSSFLFVALKGSLKDFP